MKDFEIKSSNRTRWINQRESITQPNGIDYNQLFDKLKNNNDNEKNLNVKSSVNKKDLRKKSYKMEDFSKEEDFSLSDVDKKSIIPIPGMLIDYENSDSDTRPPDSDWIAPHGPQWGPITL